MTDKNNNDKMLVSKKILCFNITNNIICTYGQKCMYAHSLNEQKIEPMRHKVYTILKNNNDLSKLNLINDPKLLDTMLQLTKICIMCVKNSCPGGYNCRNGAINTKFRICYDDLIYGKCKRLNCTSVHLTSRNLVPYNVQKQSHDDKTHNDKTHDDKSYDDKSLYDKSHYDKSSYDKSQGNNKTHNKQYKQNDNSSFIKDKPVNTNNNSSYHLNYNSVWNNASKYIFMNTNKPVDPQSTQNTQNVPKNNYSKYTNNNYHKNELDTSSDKSNNSDSTESNELQMQNNPSSPSNLISLSDNSINPINTINNPLTNSNYQDCPDHLEHLEDPAYPVYPAYPKYSNDNNYSSDTNKTTFSKTFKYNNNNIYSKKKYIKSNRVLKNVTGILLTEKFLMNRFNTNNISDSSDTSEDDVKNIIDYLNNEVDDGYFEESIFKA